MKYDSVITSDGLRVAYRRSGQGPPVVLLHGFLGDSREWESVQESLASGFDVVAWDAPGAGQSFDPPESYRLPDYADRLAELLDALHLDRVHMVGLSFGGALALEFCRRHQSRMRTLILTSAYAGWPGSLPANEVAARLESSLRLARGSVPDLVAAMLPTMFPASTPAEMVDGYAALMADVRPGGFRTMARALAEADLRDVLPMITTPTLLVYGDADVRAPRPVADALHAGIAGSQLVMLPGIGHLTNVQAAPALTAEIRAFLSVI